MESPVRDRIAELVPRVREEAARTEAERGIATEVLAALMDSGLFTTETPHAGRDDELLDAVRQVAGGCGSTGWLMAQAGTVAWLLDLFPAAARSDLKGTSSADPLVAHSLEPGGRLTEQDGELRLSGTWPAVTGASYSGWLLLGSRRARHLDGPGPLGLVLVPADACRLTPGVDTVGLTAVGAMDVTADSVVVPEHACCDTQGTRAAEDLLPVGAAPAMALLGAAQGALDTHLAQVGDRIARSHGGEQVRSGDLSPTMAGRAAAIIDAATLLLSGPVATDPDALPQDPYEQQVYAVNRAVQATGLVFSSIRSHVLDNADPVARLWRDVRVGAQQARAITTRLRTLGS